MSRASPDRQHNVVTQSKYNGLVETNIYHCLTEGRGLIPQRGTRDSSRQSSRARIHPGNNGWSYSSIFFFPVLDHWSKAKQSEENLCGCSLQRLDSYACLARFLRVMPSLTTIVSIPVKGENFFFVCLFFG